MSSPLSFKQKLGLEFFRRFRHNNAKLHPLNTLFWECTLRCNMNCRHCGSDCRKETLHPDMPKEDFLKVIDEITPHIDPHHTFITITGGEALLRHDLEEVGLELYRRGFPWGFVTNGYLLDETRLNSLMCSGLHSVAVSLDGFEEDHNWLRQNSASFQHAIHAIQLLVANPDVLFDVVTCVNPRNFAQLEALRDYLISLGVRHWRVFTIFPMGRAAQNPDLQLSDEQFRHVFHFLQSTRKENKIHVNYGCEGFLGPYEWQVRDHPFYCRAGVEVASVLVDGSISGCTSIRSNFHQGNIYRDNFWEVWQNGFQKYRDRSWTHKDTCRDCKVYRYCEGSGMHLYDNNEKLLFCHYKRLGF
jgi:radical SAM enzyme (rSAM/lipoprotein system)